MFKVHYTNFDYGHDGFSTIEAAIAHARRVCFESVILDDKKRIVASFSPINGVTYKEVDNVD